MKAARFQVEAALVRAVAAAVGLLPMAAVRTCGHGLGRVMFWVDGFHRRIALENLAHAFPSRGPAERRARATAMFAHVGGLLFELLKFGRLSREEMGRLLGGGKTALLENFVSNKTRRKFKAYLAYDKKEGKVIFEFEPRPAKPAAAAKAARKKTA